LGAQHSVSGLTAGQVLRASGAATAAFAQLAHADLGSVTADQHHAQSHVLAGTSSLGADHTVSGLTAGQVLIATGATTALFRALTDGDIPSAIGVQAGTLSVSTVNADGPPHTHAVTTSSDPGAAASILASDVNGYLRLVRMGAGIAPAAPLHGYESSTAQVVGQVIAEQAGTGDAGFQMVLSGGATWTVYISNSTNDDLFIGTNIAGHGGHVQLRRSGHTLFGAPGTAGKIPGVTITNGPLNVLGQAGDGDRGINVGSATGAAAGQIKASGFISSDVFTSQQLSFGPGGAGIPFSGASGETHYSTVMDAYRILRWVQGVYVVTTNNASNYWTITLRRIDGVTVTDIDSFTTAAFSPDTWNKRDSGALAHDVASTIEMVNVIVIKTGSPGSIYVGGPAVYVRPS